MKNIILLFLCCISLGIQSQENVRYFRRFYMDDRQCQLRVQIPVSKLEQPKTECYRVKYDNQERIAKVDFLKSNYPSKDRSGFMSVRVEYSDSIEKRFYQNVEGKPARNQLGVFSVQLMLNTQKAPVSYVNFDSNNKPMEDANGVAAYYYVLNQDGWKTETTFKNNKGERICDRSGCYLMKFNWAQDDEAYTPQISFFGKNGELSDGKRGYSVVRMRFDLRNENLLEKCYLDSTSKLTLSRDRYAIVRHKYNKKNLLTETIYYDKSERVTQFRGDLAVKEFKYNQYGNPTSVYRYPNENRKLFIELKYEYYDNGLTRRISSWKNGKQLITNEQNCAISDYKYDEFGRCIEIDYLGENNKPIELNQDKIASIVVKYDSAGNKIEEKYFGLDGKLKNNYKGIATIVRKFKENGDLESKYYTNASGAIVSPKNNESPINDDSLSPNSPN